MAETKETKEKTVIEKIKETLEEETKTKTLQQPICKLCNFKKHKLMLIEENDGYVCLNLVCDFCGNLSVLYIEGKFINGELGEAVSKLEPTTKAPNYTD